MNLASFKNWLICFLLVWPFTANASYFRFNCPNGTETEVYDSIDGSWSDALKFVPAAPVTLRFQSPGGRVDQEEAAAYHLETFAELTLLKTKTIPKVIVTDTCASACTIFLAALNRLAGQNKITLHVAADVQLGFHAAINAISGEVQPFEISKNYYLRNGVSAEWLALNQNVFETTRLKWVLPNSTWIQNSMLLNNADLISSDAANFAIPSSQDCTQAF